MSHGQRSPRMDPRIPGFGPLIDVVNFVVDAAQFVVLKVGVDVVQCVALKC